MTDVRDDASVLLAAAGVVSLGEGGETRLHTAAATTPVEVTPPLAQLFASTAGPGHVTATVRTADGRDRVLTLARLANRPDTYLAFDLDAVDAGRAQVLEGIVNQIAHDIRNHAFTIGLQSELGARRAETAPEVRGHFEAILRQLDGLKRYIDQLLLYGRPTRLSLGDCDPVGLVREQVQQFQFGWDKAAPPVSIEVRVEGEPHPVRWDRAAISQVMRALLDNAARSATPAPPIVVRLRVGVEGAEIAVCDCGAGIPAELLARLEAPMAARRAGGAGLGVAIVRKLIAAHKGDVTIETGPGGTTVRVRLPREADAD
jgi:two-component system OmpR family sensor kinase